MSDVHHYAVHDYGERKTHLVSWQDCEPILDNNKRLQSTPQKAETFRHIGTIPNVILFRWLKEEWDRGNTTLRYLSQEFLQLIARKLRDPDWMWLRTDAPSNKTGYRNADRNV